MSTDITETDETLIPNEDGVRQTYPIDDEVREADPTKEGEPENVPVESDDEPETFPAEYVQKLRKEAADNRVKAKDRDDLAQRLHVALVAATGLLADPDDLDYDEGHLSDPEALQAAITDLTTRKPHLASRKPRGSIGQGVGGASHNVDLAGILRARAS